MYSNKCAWAVCHSLQAHISQTQCLHANMDGSVIFFKVLSKAALEMCSFKILKCAYPQCNSTFSITNIKR